MKDKQKFLIIGGDNRQLYMADYFEKLGHKVEIYGLPENNRFCCRNIYDEIKNTENIILPLPFSKDGKHLFSIMQIKETVDELISISDKNNRIFAGMVTDTMKAKLEKKGSKVYDYFKREEVTVMNAVPTVQGILKAIIDNIDYTINSSTIAVFGYGRIGSLTADILSSIGAEVTVCVRKYSDLAKASSKGIDSLFIRDFSSVASKYDIIINTVPATVIGREILNKVSKSCLIIDVASAPYGTDFAVASELGINAILYSSLPGKVAPKTAGEIIAKGVLNIIKEEFGE